MASINYAAREISVKIVYYGPGLSGKTTNLQIIHKKVPKEYKSDMVSLATETDRTLFFDFLPLDLGKIKGFSAKFQLYTVPGQVYYNATRKLVLRGVDGIVFVADSSPQKVQENIESFQNMEDNLAEYGYKRDNISIIIQYNKRDLPNAMQIEELNRAINKYNMPWSEAVANKGTGVFESLKMIGKIVIDQLNQKYSRQPAKQQASGQQRMPMPPKSPPPPPSSPPPIMERQQQMYAPPPPPPPPPSSYQREQPKPDYQDQFSPFVDNYGAGAYGRAPAGQQPPPPPPPPQMPPRQPAAPAQDPYKKDYSDYNSINIEPMNEGSWTQYHQELPPNPQQQFSMGPTPAQKSGLDLEIERYEREIQERPTPQFQGPQQFPQTPQMPPPPPPQQQRDFYAQQPQQQQQMPPYQQQQPAAHGFGEAYFEVDAQNPAPQQYPPQPQQFGGNQFGGGFNAPPQQFGQQSQEPQAPFGFPQQQMPPVPGSMPNPRQYDASQPNNNPMYFTSINAEKSRKRGKKPVNPKMKPKGGLFGKFFSKESE